VTHIVAIIQIFSFVTDFNNSNTEGEYELGHKKATISCSFMFMQIHCEVTKRMQGRLTLNFLSLVSSRQKNRKTQLFAVSSLLQQSKQANKPLRFNQYSTGL